MITGHYDHCKIILLPPTSQLLATRNPQVESLSYHVLEDAWTSHEPHTALAAHVPVQSVNVIAEGHDASVTCTSKKALHLQT